MICYAQHDARLMKDHPTLPGLPASLSRRMIPITAAEVRIDPDFDVPVLFVAWDGQALTGLYTEAHKPMLRANIVRAWDGKERMTLDVPFDLDNEDAGGLPVSEAIVSPQAAALQWWLQQLPDDEARKWDGKPVDVPTVKAALAITAAIPNL